MEQIFKTVIYFERKFEKINIMSKKILITGVSGFIGFHLAKSLLNKKYKIFGVDNFSKSYETNIKKVRTLKLKK